MRKLLVALALLAMAVSCRANEVKHYKVQVVAEYPHSTGAYTQGLFFKGDTLCESAGQWGESAFRKFDLETGKIYDEVKFSKKYFVEGSTILNGNLYVLSWTNKVAWIYDAGTLEYKKTYSYPREGWGLTTDGECLIASDGSSHLYFLSPDFKQLRSVNVTLNGRSVRYLNELEYIDGKVWANVYTTDIILIINPADGKVEATVDCEGLLPQKDRDSRTDVLNGIAWQASTRADKTSGSTYNTTPASAGRLYLTGKYWPKLYEVRLIEQK